MLDLTIKKEITIKASSGNVWDVLTNPQHISKYLFGTKAVSDWQKGSSLTFSGEYQGQKYEDHGTILDLKKGELLKYDYWSSFSGIKDSPENYSTITFKLSAKKNITKLTILQKGFVSKEAYEHSQKNWNMVIDTIKDIAEGLP